MNIEGLDKRIKRGATVYYKDGVMVGRKCTGCGKDKEINEFSFRNKRKGTYCANCKECRREYLKQYHQNNEKRILEKRRQRYENNKEYMKQWRENNPNYGKQYRENNKEKIAEYCRTYRETNREKLIEYNKQYRGKNKENNLQYISSIVEQVNPIMKELPVYGYIYLFTNIKTGHRYVGQSTLQLKTRYGYEGGIVKSWIKERMKYNNQKFKDELIEEDIEVTEVFDVAFCQYHLDKLEAYWINYYDSRNNGYNNECGNHNTTDGLDEFNEILKTYNLQYIDGKLIKAPTIK